MGRPILLALQVARANGDLTYFTGKPCKHGHVSSRLTSTQVCVQCGKEIHQLTDRNKYRYKDTFKRQFSAVRQKAKRNNIPFTIKYEELELPEFCPVLGLKLNYRWRELDTTDYTKASIDKLIPALGYVPGNVFVISWRANRLKNNMTIDELEKILDYMKRNTHG